MHHNLNLTGQTALHLAVLAHGKKQASSNSPIDSGPVIRALIKKGADPCIQVQIYFTVQGWHLSSTSKLPDFSLDILQFSILSDRSKTHFIL